MSWYGALSYGLSALAYGAVAVILLLGRPEGQRAGWMIAAVAATLLWSIAALAISLAGLGSAAAIAAIDAVHSLVWTFVILSFLAPSSRDAPNSARRWFLAVAAGAAAWSIGTAAALGAAPAMYLGFIVMSVVGLLAVEQVFRNAGEEQRAAFRLLGLAIGGVFTVDFFVYSHAALLGGLGQGLWETRGIASAAFAPLIVLALRQHPEWGRGVFVSRYMAFYTASLLGVGTYLLAMASIAYLIRAIGGEWNLLLQLVFFAAALIVLGIALFSTTLRARFKVFLVKHFYRSKYDYRAEWLRLTDTLGRAADIRSLAHGMLEGLAAIVGSRNGDLWITRDGKHYDWMLSLAPGVDAKPAYGDDHPMVVFLASRRWVIDSEQYAKLPDHYDTAFGAPNDNVLPRMSLIVPLDCRGRLQGFVVLEKPAQMSELNFDDHDILKTAGKQVATFYAQALAQEQLAATRQFEAVNKLSTFLMHDLKNVVAQQALVVANAQRFGDRPEFIKDAIETLRSGVERMKSVLGQLKSVAADAHVSSRSDLTKVLIEVRSRCADRQPVPDVTRSDEPVWIHMDRDKLASVLVHLIRNAQDATPADGRIAVELERRDGSVTLAVSDTGCGMAAEFIRDRLFTPFDSTKGAEGMGIGAYQVRELVRAAGGTVEVTSAVGAGTTFRLVFPRDAEPPALREAG